MGRKLIFLDIDGTLLPPGDMLIPESTLAALDRARANGHKLFLCTGRNHRMTEPLLRHDCFAGAVCSAGGYVLCDGKTLVDIPMEPQQAEGVRAALVRNGVECTLEARDATFGGSKMAERWKFIHKKRCTAEQRSRTLAQSHGRGHVHPAAFRLQRGTAV